MTAPATMFMHWKVPTRLIVDDPSYRSQKATLLADSNQRFYEDINGTKEFTKLPAVPSSSSGVQLTQQAIARSLNPKAVPAAEDWLRSVGKSEKKVIQRALQAADKSYIDSALKRTLQPDAQKAVEKWMEKANPKDRELAINFFGSLAGSKLMGAKEGFNHDLHRDQNGEILCKMCDGDKLQQVMAALKKGQPVAAVTLSKGKQNNERLRHLRLLTPNTRKHREEFQTWHHLPSFKHPGPVSNTIALFTRPHRPIQRHFTIHPEWE